MACRKGTTLFHQGEPCDNLYRIVSGRCESYQLLPDGTVKSLEILGPGDCLGEPDLFGRSRHQTCGRVITDSVLQEIRNSDLRTLLAQNSDQSTFFSRAQSDPEFSTGRISHIGRIVAAVSVSDRLSAGLIGNLAQNLHVETGESVLLVDLKAETGSHSSPAGMGIQAVINSNGHLSSQLKANGSNGSIARLTLKVTDDSREPEFVAPFLSHLSRHFDYVLVQAGAQHLPIPLLLQFIMQADTSFLFLHPNEEDVGYFESLMNDLRSEVRGDCSDINPVVCLARGERIQDRLELANTVAHAFVHECPMNGDDVESATFARDIRRLAREIGHCRIGIALSAGGAKGLAHIGVIQVLEENGIEIDVIAGCSMGAYVAAVWALGYDGQFMEKLARQVEGRWGLWKLIDPVIPPRRGFILGEAVINRLRKTVGDAQFSDLLTPLRVVATNLDTLERVVFSNGEIAGVIHASCAIPGVCVPVTMDDGETYIDGGVADPLPVDVLAEMGIDRIIAVNTLPTSAFLRCCREKEREQAEVSKKRLSKFRLFTQQLNYFARGNILDIMMSAVHGAQIRVAEQFCRQASVVLRPLSIDAKWHDFNHPGKYITLGRQIALQHLDELKNLARRKVAHEVPSVNGTLAAVA